MQSPDPRFVSQDESQFAEYVRQRLVVARVVAKPTPMETLDSIVHEHPALFVIGLFLAGGLLATVIGN